MADLNTIGGLHYEMMRKCYNTKSVLYSCYGGIGIEVCDDWKNREIFKRWCIENGWLKGLRLNRIDSKKNYCPENCFFGKAYSKKSSKNAENRKRAIENKEKRR